MTSKKKLYLELIKDYETANLHQERLNELNSLSEKEQYEKRFVKFFVLKHFIDSNFTYENKKFYVKENKKLICCISPEIDLKPVEKIVNTSKNKSIFYYHRNIFLKPFETIKNLNEYVFKYFELLLPNNKFISAQALICFFVNNKEQGNFYCSNFPLSLVETATKLFIASFTNDDIFKLGFAKYYILNSELSEKFRDEEIKCKLNIELEFLDIEDDFFHLKDSYNDE